MMKQSTRHAVSADAEGQVRPDGLPRRAEGHNIFFIFLHLNDAYLAENS